MSRGPVVGLALSVQRVAAWLSDGDVGEGWERPLAPFEEERGEWPELASTLVELVERGGRAPRLHVALLPPAVHFRTLPLPDMRERERVRLLERDIVRFFPVVGEAVVGAVAAPGRRAGLPIAAAVAPTALLRAIEGAARDAGAEVERVIPAQAAWLAAARAAWPEMGEGRWALLIAGPERLDVLRLDDGWPMVHRRLARGPHASERLREMLVAPDDAATPPVALLGDRASWETAMADAGVAPLAGPLDGASPALVAARFAPTALGLELVPVDARERRAASDRRWSVRLAAASLGCLAIAGVLELWGGSRQAAVLEQRRAAIHARVAQAVAARDTATVVTDRLVAIASLRESTPRWSSLLTMLAHRLPDDAYLVSLRAEGDSASLEGVAASAVEVIAALRATPGVSAVRADAPIRQELGAGGALVERFAVTLRLAPADIQPTSAAVARRDAP